MLFLLMSSTQGKKRNSIITISFILSFIYAVLDEFHQYFVPGRFSSIFDIGIDSAGIFFAALFYLAAIKFRNIKYKL